jgi:hypothetical protein
MVRWPFSAGLPPSIRPNVRCSPFWLASAWYRQPGRTRLAGYWDSQTFVGSMAWILGTNTALWTRPE